MIPPKILALQSATQPGSITLAQGTELLVSQHLDPHLRTAQSFAPAIASALSQAKWTAEQVDLFAVNAGPGSFTGLRIGVTAAKVFAYATQCHVLAFNTLDIIAAGTPPLSGQTAEQTLWVIMDAQRRGLHVRRYRIQAASRAEEFAPLPTSRPLYRWEPKGETALLAWNDWRNQVRPGHLISGPAVQRPGGDWPQGARIVDAAWHRPSADVLAAFAFEQFREGRRDDFWHLVPDYHRRSAAQERRQDEND